MNYYSLLLLSVCAGASVVVVDLGENATLNCSYPVPLSGPLSSCWSRGVLPSYGMCGGNTIISSDRNTGIKSVSQRYVLGGHLGQGDVSITILNTTREDTGTYGCRVDIPGWNNDLKHHYILKIRQDHMTISSHMSSLDHVTSSDLVTHVEPIWTSSGPRTEETSASTVLLVSLLLPLLFITTATILIIMKKWHLFQKMSENLSSVHFNSTASTFHLEQRSQPEDNIYN